MMMVMMMMMMTMMTFGQQYDGDDDLRVLMRNPHWRIIEYFSDLTFNEDTISNTVLF